MADEAGKTDDRHGVYKAVFLHTHCTQEMHCPVVGAITSSENNCRVLGMCNLVGGESKNMFDKQPLSGLQR